MSATNNRRDYIILALILALAGLGFVAVQQRADYLALRSQHNATTERAQNLAAKVENREKLLMERPVVVRYLRGGR